MDLRGGLQLPVLVVIAVLGCDVSLACTNGGIRLVGGASNLEGRVEICNSNTWGTVCDPYWAAADANVVCGQLGFSRSGSIARSYAFFGRGTGPILLRDVLCLGTEAQLVNCPSDNSIVGFTCGHWDDVGVTCLNCTDGELRLVNGSNHTEGRVEMCYNAVWGTVCDDVWDSSDAIVVCRQLGFFPTGATAIPLAFGQGNGSIWLDNVECTGNETQLIACSHNVIGSHNCTHSQDASVRCQACTSGDIRLVGGASNLEGRVEICDSATWGTVCEWFWGTADANVACGQLGFSRSGSIARSSDFFGRGTGPILLDEVLCLGTEAQLVNCPGNRYGYCYHSEDAGVTCQNTTQIVACYDDAAPDCNGGNVTGVSTARECCLGDGYWFQDPNLGEGCQQCIVDGFERTVVSVDEGTSGEIVFRVNIKGNAVAEDPRFRVLILLCYDETTERGDYFTDCFRTFLLNPYDSEENVTITIPADNDALEGTEVLLLIPEYQIYNSIAGNIFLQHTSIQIHDTTVLRSGFSEENYLGNEGPDQQSTRPNMPCTVTIRLLNTTIEDNLTFQLTPQTISEYTDANGGPPIGTLTGTNASRTDFNGTPFEVTMAAGTTVVTAEIPIVDDEISEAEEEFVVVLEVVSNTTNPVEFTTNATVCRIPASDRATCYDNAAENCGGNVIPGVSTRDCCLGDGFWVNQTNGECVQCIVHGFENASVMVDEGDLQVALAIRLDIKGNTTNVTNINFTVTSTDISTEQGDYNITDYNSFVQLLIPENMTSRVLINFPPDNNASEGTERLMLRLQLSASTQAEVTDAENIFFQDAFIQIRDTTALRLGFEEEEYSGSEGPTNQPCGVVVHLQNTTTEAPLTLQLFPQTIPENVAASSSLLTSTLRGTNASRMDFNHTPFEVTMAAGNTSVSANISIVDDEINEAEEVFVVVLEVVSNTTNPLEFTTNTTVCRIPASDPIEIGFRHERVNHSETEANYTAALEKDRPSEQTFQLEILISTPHIMGLGEPANQGDDFQANNVSIVTLTPDDNQTEIVYQIVGDKISERLETFLVSSRAIPNTPAFDCDGQVCYSELQVSVIDDDVVVVGFVETLVEVNETDGTAALNVSIHSPPSDVVFDFGIVLLVNTMDGSARSSCSVSNTNSDFTGICQFLNFVDAQQPQTILVPITDDNVTEGVEELTVRLSLQDMELETSVNVTPAVATVRILDDDSPAQFKMCYDNAATDCNGTAVVNVTTARDCCLGDGYWFDDEDGWCHQCIVHGFVNTLLVVDEGSQRQIIQIRRNIKGSASDELGFTLTCNNTSSEQEDYRTRACNSTARLEQNDPIQVAIDFPQDNGVALEGTEELLMEIQLSQEQESTFTTAGNIFIHNVSVIQIRDITNITLGFLQEVYNGNEGSDQLPNMPCRVNISLHNTIIEAPLTLRLIPRTIPENFADSGPFPTAVLRGANASRMDFNDTPFEVTMAAGSEVVTAGIPIFDDEINEAEEEFVVVLEVVSNTTNSVEFTTQTTVCRISQSDPINIGFTQARVEHNESEANFSAVIRKNRQSEQTFDIQIIIINTAQTIGFSPATQGPGSEEVPNPDFVVSTTSVTLAPEQNESVILYQILEDNIPENTEIFQLSAVVSNPAGTLDIDDDLMFQFNGSEDLQVQILDDDVLGTIGFMETLIDVNESIGEATLNVSLTINSSIQFEIMFSLFANTMNGSTAGIEDYQQIENMSLDFNNTERSQTFSLMIREDDVPEGVEELNVMLSLQDPNLANQVIVEPAVATVRILDNDSVVVGFNKTTYMVNETDEQVELCVIVSVPEDQNIGDVTFNLAVETQNGTAMGSGTVSSGMMGSGMMGSGAECDYMSVMTTLTTFTMEQPTQCFNVTIIDDTEVETTEHFFARLTLTSVTTIDSNRITVAPAQTTVNIMDNDGFITVGYNETAVNISERAGLVQLHVSISVPEASVTIDNSVFFYLLVNTSNTTATADSHLGPFSNDVRELSFNVSIEDDMIPEENEEFTATLTLSPADQARFGNLVSVEPDLATVTIMDDDDITSTASTSLLSSVIPSPSSVIPSPSSILPSPLTSPMTISPANFWPVLFAPLAVVLLVLLIIAVAAIVYCKRRSRNLRRKYFNFKYGPSKEPSPEDSRTKRVHEAHRLASHRPSIQLRRMLPRGMIIPSSVLKLQDSIGQGEFGVVYKAHLQWHLDAATEVVAVKTLKGLFTPDDVDNLVQEVLKMHTLSHPNVMSLTGVCLDSGGGPAIVMPFMGNGSVLHYVKKERGKLVPRDDADCSVISDAQTQLLGMCFQISKGMEYLAKEKIVHRDLAARNCMMDTSGVIKVADFGLSVDIYTSSYYRRRKSDTAVKLPVKWMAPESTEDGIFTEKSDVWSFGVTCWEVFTGGHIPYSGISPVAMLQLLHNGERLNKPMNPACSHEIYAILLDCWKEEPKERPDFSKLVDTISLILEAAAGYMELSLSIKDEHPLVAAEVEVKTRGGGSSVQSPSEEGGQQETAV